MARPLRIDYPGAIHHVMNRGADHQITFRDEADRHVFLGLWRKAVARFGIEVISFALLGNHYHFLVRSPDAQLSTTLQFIGRSYTQKFNNFHGRDGALFRGRFHSIVVDSDVYLARVARYIELNPVRAGLVSLEMAHRYEWSSLRQYAASDPRNSWLAVEQLLARFSSPQHFVEFVRSNVSDLEVDRFYRHQFRSTRVLGKEGFAASIRAMHGVDQAVDAGVPESSVEAVEMAVMAVSGTDRRTLKEGGAGFVNPARSVAVSLAHHLGGATRKELMQRYAYSSETAVASAIWRAWHSNNPAICELRERAMALLECRDGRSVSA